MYQAIDLFLEMLTEDNAVMKFISKNKRFINSRIINEVVSSFPTIGYGDTQYIELINKIKKEATQKYRCSFLSAQVILIFSTNFFYRFH